MERHMLAKLMRWVGRIIGLAAAGFFLTFLVGEAIGEAISEDGGTLNTAGVLLASLSALALVSCILSWWRERLAGIMLVLIAIALGIQIGVLAGQNHFLVWLTIGFPYLLAGGLLLSAWWLERRSHYGD